MQGNNAESTCVLRGKLRIRPHRISARGGRPRKKREDDPYAAIRLARLQARAGEGRPAMGEYPLGALLARGIIDPAMHDAGCFYALHYTRAVGKTRLSTAALYAQLQGVALPGGDDRDSAYSQRLYRDGRRHLAAIGRQSVRLVDDTAVFGQFPSFLMGIHRSLAEAERSQEDLADLRAGLRALVRYYQTGTGRPLPRMQAVQFDSPKASFHATPSGD